MSRKLLITFLICLSFQFTSAQSVKLTLGPTFSKMEWKNSMSNNTLFDENYTGFTSMLGVDYLKSKFFFLSSNLGYSNYGGKGTIHVTTQTGEPWITEMEQKTSLHMLSINTLAHIKFSFGSLTPFLGLGPRLDYLVSYEEEVSLLKQFEDDGGLNRVLFGINSTAGLQYQVRSFEFGLLFQYNYNFNNMVDYTSQWDVTNEIELGVFIVALSVGYQLK